MVNKILDWIVNTYIGTYLTGWHTKMGAGVTTILGVNACLLVLAQALLLAQDGKYVEAAYQLNSPEMWGGLALLGITKQMLGVAHKVEKAQTGELAIDVAKAEDKLPKEEKATITSNAPVSKVTEAQKKETKE